MDQEVKIYTKKYTAILGLGKSVCKTNHTAVLCLGIKAVDDESEKLSVCSVNETQLRALRDMINVVLCEEDAEKFFEKRKKIKPWHTY